MAETENANLTDPLLDARCDCGWTGKMTRTAWLAGLSCGNSAKHTTGQVYGLTMSDPAPEDPIVYHSGTDPIELLARLNDAFPVNERHHPAWVTANRWLGGHPIRERVTVMSRAQAESLRVRMEDVAPLRLFNITDQTALRTLIDPTGVPLPTNDLQRMVELEALAQEPSADHGALREAILELVLMFRRRCTIEMPETGAWFDHPRLGFREVRPGCPTCGAEATMRKIDRSVDPARFEFQCSAGHDWSGTIETVHYHDVRRS